MAVPQDVYEKALALDKDNNDIVIRCPKCSDYGPKRVDADDYDEAEKAFNQAKRQYGSHYSQKHKETSGGQGGSTQEKGPSKQQQGGNKSQGRSSGGQPSQPTPQQGEQPPQQQAGADYGGGTNERELIYRKGEDGLLQLKEKRLKDWLEDANGVSGQTQSRIVKVFKRNESVNSNPYALYNLLEDETNASGSYINTMVDDVFEPEREHEDILEQTGYTPFFRRSNAQGQFQTQNQGMNGGQTYGQSASGQSGPRQQQQGYNQPRQQQQPQQTQRPQQSSTDNSVSREEVAQIVSQGINTAKEESEENPLRDGLSDATDEALREMASNVGGLAGTANRVFEEALMSYAQENPEFIIENMDFLQNALGAAQGPDNDNNNSKPGQAESTQKVDQALEQLGDGGQVNQNTNTHQTQQPNRTRQQTQRQPNTHQEPRQSQRQQSTHTDTDVPTDVEPQESGYEPSHSPEPKSSEPQDGDENGSSVEEDDLPPIDDEQPPEPKPTPGSEESKKSEQRRNEFEDKQDESSENEEAFDELFGDMAE